MLICFWYILTTCCLFTFMVGPISPPGMLKSRGMIIHFWIFCALLTASLFAASIPAWIPRITSGSGSRTSWTVLALLPTDLELKIFSLIWFRIILLACTNLELMMSGCWTVPWCQDQHPRLESGKLKQTFVCLQVAELVILSAASS